MLEGAWLEGAWLEAGRLGGKGRRADPRPGPPSSKEPCMQQIVFLLLTNNVTHVYVHVHVVSQSNIT